MKQHPTIRLATAAAVLTFLVFATLVAAPAEARRGFGGHGRGFVGVRAIGFYSPAFYGFHGYRSYFGYEPYFGYGYSHRYPAREGGIDPTVARMMGWGAVDVDVKPRKAEVWVDGKFVGTAGSLDGYPSYLWLKEGTHEITIQKGGYTTYEQEVAVHPGTVTGIKLKLLPDGLPQP